jgi:hypothetical protein
MPHGITTWLISLIHFVFECTYMFQLNEETERSAQRIATLSAENAEVINCLLAYPCLSFSFDS